MVSKPFGGFQLSCLSAQLINSQNNSVDGSKPLAKND